MRGRRLAHSVVVITGASSGIGRATALAFARRGARIVVAARREAALRTLVERCAQLGGLALAVPTDVTDEAAVYALARRAVEHFGQLDVWVNNAGVYLVGRFERTPTEVFGRVLETNLLGYVYGARAALEHFRRVGDGVLINNGSIGSTVPLPYASAYTASKAAVYGFSMALRQELRGSGIQVCVVLPAMIDTPIFQHAANFVGRPIKPMRPIYDACRVARAIVGLAEQPRREVVVGPAGRWLCIFHAIAPDFAERVVKRLYEVDQFLTGRQAPTTGNLFTAKPEWTTISGDWKSG